MTSLTLRPPALLQIQIASHTYIIASHITCLSAFCSSLLHYSAFSAPLGSSCPPFLHQPPWLSISPIPLFPHGACCFSSSPLSFCFPLSRPALPCLFVCLALLFLWGGGVASVAYPSSPSLITSAVPSQCCTLGPTDFTKPFFFLSKG